MPVRSGKLQEIHVAAAPPVGLKDPASCAKSVYQSIVAKLEEPGSLQIVAERVFGALTDKEAFLGGRAEVLPEAGNPVSYIEGAPIEGQPRGGVQLTLVRCGDRGVEIEPILEGKDVRGYTVTTGRVRRVFLSSMHGLKSGSPPPSATEQAQSMFRRTDKLLNAAGLAYQNVTCTRIYIRRLLEWYDEFNGVRTPFYRKVGVMDSQGPFTVPSSTGIQGKMSDECECVMDVTAVSTGDETRSPFVTLHNPLQNEATAYGSSFARGSRVQLRGVHYIIVSGTASINEEGKSIHVGDAQGQTRRTMDNFESILRVGGGQLSDLCRVVWFCKDPSHASVVREEMRRRGWPDFPYVMAHADVCRKDLLVEVDGMALLTSV